MLPGIADFWEMEIYTASLEVNFESGTRVAWWEVQICRSVLGWCAEVLEIRWQYSFCS